MAINNKFFCAEPEETLVQVSPSCLVAVKALNQGTLSLRAFAFSSANEVGLNGF